VLMLKVAAFVVCFFAVCVSFSFSPEPQ
jgi:hypothetical protein